MRNRFKTVRRSYKSVFDFRVGNRRIPGERLIYGNLFAARRMRHPIARFTAGCAALMMTVYFSGITFFGKGDTRRFRRSNLCRSTFRRKATRNYAVNLSKRRRDFLRRAFFADARFFRLIQNSQIAQ